VKHRGSIAASQILLASVAFLFVMVCQLFGQSVDMSGGGVAFVVSADLNGDEVEEIIVGMAAMSQVHIAEFAIPGDVYVYACGGDRPAECALMQQAFQCRSGIPESHLAGFFEPSLVSTVDLDQDGLLEVIIVWYEQFWWPTAYRPLSILQFDPELNAYEMVTDVERYVGEIGGYAVEDVDDDGVPEIVEVDPIYGTEVNPMSGDEEYECHYCPHKYSVRVFEFNGTAFDVDSAFNSGELYVTADKYQPEVAWEAISVFLPELLTEVRSLVHESSYEH